MSSHFDGAKYERLLEGLETVVIRRSQLNEELRFEAEFFQKRYLHEDSALARWEKRGLGEFSKITDGPHGYHVVDDLSPIAMLTAKCAADWFAERIGADLIATWVDEKNRRSSLEVGDIILSTRGTVGNCALVTEEALPANIDQDVARISLGGGGDFLPEFVVAYLNSKYGQDHIGRHASGMVQQGLSLEKVRQIPIPLLSRPMQFRTREVIRAALELRRQAVRSFKSAETTLLQLLGLSTWKPPDPLSYSRRALEIFAERRFDAEFHSPIYDALFEVLHQHGDLRLGDTVREPIRRGISPEYVDRGDLLVINSQHVGKTHITLDENRTTSLSLCNMGTQNARNGIVKKGDVLLNSTGRITIGRSQCLLDDVTAVVDNHVAIIRPNEKLDPVYLACFLNSLPGQMQTERSYTGSSGQIELRPDLLGDYRIWLAPRDVQLRIRSAVEAFHVGRCEALHLLERAKRAVEIAIEDSESAALHHLNDSLR